ncbi:MAG: group III truncated hemoglobin [Ferruginibacter sp.]
MDIKMDIEKRGDIEKFLLNFYEDVKADDTIGIVFTKVVPMNWEHHIPLITDFWESILLDNPVYKKNAMEVHYHLNKIFPLQEKHFTAWLNIFNRIIDKMYEGPVTELAKKRAASIASLMLYKMTGSATIKNNT